MTQLKSTISQTNGMKGRIFLLALLLMTPNVLAQNPADEKAKTATSVNIGVKAGFNSSILSVSECRIGQTEILEMENNYEVGYFGSLFLRFNFNKHFLQPEISYNLSKSGIRFNKNGRYESGNNTEKAYIATTLRSIDTPILYGCHIVKKGPYGMAVFGGPKLRYLWKGENQLSFGHYDFDNVNEELHLLNMSFVLGVAVNISSIFFDFRYEGGLLPLSKAITYDYAEGGTVKQGQAVFQRRENALNFSLGFMF